VVQYGGPGVVQYVVLHSKVSFLFECTFWISKQTNKRTMSGTDVEMSQKSRNESVDSNLSRFSTAINDTILDNVVNRFSFVNDHKVRGQWRTALSFAVVAVPLTVFSVLLWYQLTQTCIVGTASFPTTYDSSADTLNAQADSLRSLVNSFLCQDGVHYCKSTFSFGYNEITSPTKVSFYTETDRCYLDGIHIPKEDADYCSNTFNGLDDYYRVYEGATDEENSCFHPYINVFNITVFYTQCIPWQTALVNSLQCAVYSVAVTIVVYLGLRICKKFGLTGICNSSKWLEMLKNNKKDWKNSDIESPMA
jgi:hypothetical protein